MRCGGTKGRLLRLPFVFVSKRVVCPYVVLISLV